MITNELCQDVESRLGHLLEIGKINLNSSYNEVVIAYWRYFDKLGEKLLIPNELTPYQSIDRVWRKVFRQEKGDESGVKEYVSWEKREHRIEILPNGKRRIVDI